MIVKTKAPFPEYYPTGNKQVYQLSKPNVRSTKADLNTHTNISFSGRKKGLIAYLSNMAKNNPGLLESNVATIVVCTIRPLTVLMTPGADKRDKQYAATQSIASGIVGFTTGYIIFNPLKNAMDKFKKQKAMPNFTYSEKSVSMAKTNVKAVENFINIFNHFTKVWTAPLMACLMIGIMPVLMNKIFPKKKNADVNQKSDLSKPINAAQLTGSKVNFTQLNINTTLFKSFIKEGTN